MFEANSRFMTCGIKEQLPTPLLVQLWMSIDTQINAGLEMDYLQVFRFEKVSDLVLAIRHEQEQPERKTVIYCEYRKDYEKLLQKIVYIIDDGDHSTVLFLDEY